MNKAETVYLAVHPATVGLFGVTEQGDALQVLGVRRTATKRVLVVAGQTLDGTDTTYWLRPEHLSNGGE